jgi:hypothetical protein
MSEIARRIDYDGLLSKFLILLAVVACSKSDDKKPPATVDPWATPAKPADDPKPAEDPAPAAANTLAGTYQCLTLRYGTAVNGMHQSAYVASALGAFEIDADGAYRSASYPDKGSGRTHVEAATVTFEDGPYAGYTGEVGKNSSGAYIRFNGEKLSEAPAPNMRFNDHICNRR